GLTVLTAAYAMGHISGGHFNPAVTVGVLVARRIEPLEALVYVVCQVVGAIAGAAIIVAIASGVDGFSVSESGLAANGFADHSPGGYDWVAALVSEVVMTFFFLLVILGVTGPGAPAGFGPLAIGLALTLIHLISIPVTNTSGEPGPLDRPGGVRRRLGDGAAVDVLAGAARRRRAGRAGPHVRDRRAPGDRGGLQLTGAGGVDPAGDLGLQHPQADGGPAEHGVVEAPDVEGLAEPAPGVVPQAQDLPLADLVGERLAGHADVAVDLDDDLVPVDRRVGGHEVDGLLAGPAQRVEPGVDHQPAGPPGVAGQHAEAVEVGLVQAHLVGQPLGVERPALDEGGVAPRQPPEGGQVGALGGDGELQVVPGDRLVEGDRRRLGPPPGRGVVEVDVVLAGAAAV